MTTSSFVLMAIVALFSATTSPTSTLVALAVSSSKEEAKALHESGWWNGQNISTRCKWSGFVCNDAASVTEISIPWYQTHQPAVLSFSDLNFSAFQNLVFIDFTGMGLSGSIVLEPGVLTNLTHLNLSHNSLEGELPSTIANLTQLEMLDISHNNLRGEIPSALGNLKKLVALKMSFNNFQGNIPSGLGYLTRLAHLDLSANYLQGSIPLSLYELTNLKNLLLDSNKICGAISPKINKLQSLVVLDLSHNMISGRIPLELFQLIIDLDVVDLSSNQLSGSIPEGGRLCCISGTLNLSHNKLNGSIPSPLVSLGMYNLDLSYNNLSGNIPLELNSLDSINLSYNCLHGYVPSEVYCRFPEDSFHGNKGLIGPTNPCSSRSLPISKARHIRSLKIILAIITIFLLLLFVEAFLIKRYIVKKAKFEEKPVKNGDFLYIWNYDGRIAYEDIIKATEDFHIKYCIGTGAYGSVYKARLPSGRIVALKKLHQLESQDPCLDRCFRNEVEMLTKIRHKNIVQLYGYCLHNRCKFLIYKYFSRGSLFLALSTEMGALELNWNKRVNIVRGIANALSYMHHDCTTPLVHRDITSSNILLNSKWEAFVGDFGTARLLIPDSSNETTLAGTCGYIAPGEFSFFVSFDYLVLFSQVEITYSVFLLY